MYNQYTTATYVLAKVLTDDGKSSPIIANGIFPYPNEKPV